MAARDVFNKVDYGEAETDTCASDETDSEDAGLLANCRNCGCAAYPQSDVEGDGVEGKSRLQRIVDSEKFKLLVALVIMCNTIFMGMQADHPDAVRHTDGAASSFECALWQGFSTFFISFFTVEITLRLLAYGPTTFFCDPDEWAWNIFDFLVVAGGLLDHFHQILTGPRAGVGRPSFAFVAQMLRILRVLRVVRVFRSFKKLYMLARGLLESMQMVFWIGILVLLMIFLCAILCTTIIGQAVANFPIDEQAEITMYWGKVRYSMFTLFQFLTMDNWSELCNQVSRQQPYMQWFFFLYIFFGGFVIMSLLTGVMADHMNDVRRQEEEDERREKMRKRDNAISMIDCVDKDGNKMLDKEEFKTLMLDTKVQTDLQSAGVTLTKREVDELFEWFDVNGDGQIDSQELYHGLKHLFEGITGLQMYKLKSAIGRAHGTLEKRAATIGSGPLFEKRPPPSKAARQQLSDLSGHLSLLEGRMTQFEDQVHHFMHTLGWSKEDASASSPRSWAAPSPVAS